MQVTGSQLRKALVRWTIRRDQAIKTFEDNLFSFKDDNKVELKKVSNGILTAQEAVARIQTAQQEFNSRVIVSIGGKELSLAVAIKMKAGIGKVRNLWALASGQNKDSMFGRKSFSPKSREQGREEQVPTASPSEIAEGTEAMAILMAEVQDVIALGNAQTVDVKIDAELLKG